MKTVYKYIRFVHCNIDRNEHQAWICYNKRSGDPLGDIEWMSSWKQYVFAPVGDTVYSAGCLRNIADFMAQLPVEGEKP